MKYLTLSGVLAVLFSVLGSLAGAASWEGSDDFESSAVSAGKWKPWTNHRSAFQLVSAGQLRCVFINNEDDQPWVWGKKITQIPSAANWTVSADIFLPASAPNGVNASRVKVGFGVIGLPYSRNKARAVTLKVYQYFSPAYEAIKLDSSFAPGVDTQAEYYPGNHPNCRISITHDALRQKDLYRVVSLTSGEVLLNEESRTPLSISPALALGAVVAGKKNWPSGNNALGMDNWSVVENNPAPINLNAQSASFRGVAYSVAVTGLDLVNQRLTGTVAMTVGSASTSLPITGTIDRNGYFALTAKGTGANKGFGCALLYDVHTGTYRPGKNTVTAPKQKAIKF